MYRNATKIHQGDLRFDQTCHRVVNRVILMMDQLGRSARAHARRFFLLIEALAAHSLRTAFKRKEPILNLQLEFAKDTFIEALRKTSSVP